MSRFLQKRYSGLTGYTPGEQPQGARLVKLNTNESPFPPSPAVEEALASFDAGRLRLYPDPSCRELREKLAGRYGVQPEEVMVTNGSDDLLSYFFMAYCEGGTFQGADPEGAEAGSHGLPQSAEVVFPDITYSFYKVLAELHGIAHEEIPLAGDFTISPDDYKGLDANIVIANPNAPTGLMLSAEDIEEIVRNAGDHMVMIDEAYVDFGAESVIPLIRECDNLLVVQTFSKARSFAGGRVGFGIARREIIEDLEKIRSSMSPYSVNAVSQELAAAALSDDEYYIENAEEIKKNRRYTRLALSDMGFRVIPSMTNFIFVKHHDISGAELYERLKERGILIRHFDQDRIREYNRITIGAKDEMDELIKAVRTILAE